MHRTTNDTSIPRDQRRAEQLAEALGLTAACETDRHHGPPRARVAFWGAGSLTHQTRAFFSQSIDLATINAWSSALEWLIQRANAELRTEVINTVRLCVEAQRNRDLCADAITATHRDLAAIDNKALDALAALLSARQSLSSERERRVFVALYEALR